MGNNICLIFLFIFNIVDTYLVFNFRTNINLAEVTDENYMTKKFNQQIYTDIKVGTPSQTIPMTIKTWQYPTFVSSTVMTEDITVKFDFINSRTFKKKDDMLKIGMVGYDFNKGYYSQDIFEIDSSKKENFNFMLATSAGIGVHNISGGIGLSKVNPSQDDAFNPQRTRFIQQLLDNNLIDKKIFGFLYDTEYEGRLIFGAYLYEVDENYKELDINEFDMDTDVHHDYFDRWLIKFDVNCITGEEKSIIYEEPTFGVLVIEYGLIVGSTEFYEKFADKYFEKKNCQKTEIYSEQNLYIYYCTDESQFQDFPDIIFKYPGKYNFKFTKDELFIKKGDKYYFQIGFKIFAPDYSENFWYIGQPFFRKYSIFLKEVDKGFKMSYYLTQKFDKEKNEEEKSSSKQKIAIVILSLVVALLVTAIVVYFVFFYEKKKRKIRVTELEDEQDYEYFSKEKNDNNNNDKLLVEDDE